MAAFQIGDGEFISLPGEVFPFTYLRGFLGPQDMPNPSGALPPWLLPHMHTPFRFIDGLAEDMLGYIFPAGNAVGIPTASNFEPLLEPTASVAAIPTTPSRPSANVANIIGGALVRLLDHHAGRRSESSAVATSCPGASARATRSAAPRSSARAIRPSTTQVEPSPWRSPVGTSCDPARWMSLSGLPQRVPDRDTRGYFDTRGRRVWLDVFPTVS